MRRWIFVLGALAAVVSCSKEPALAGNEHVRRGNAYYETKQYREATIEYRNAVQFNPRDGTTRRKLAEAYLEVGDTTNALRELVRAADLLPENVGVQLQAGSLLLLFGQFDDAASRAKAALSLDPRSADAQILLGAALAGLRDFDAAIAEVEEAIQLDPAVARGHLTLGILESARGRHAEAEAALLEAVALEPTSVNAQLALANYYSSAGRAAEAERALLRALDLEPDSVRTNRALAVFCMLTNRAAEAEKYVVAVAKHATGAEGHLALADYYVAVQKLDNAMDVLDRLAGGPDLEVAAKTRMAAIEWFRGRTVRAKTLVEEVLEKRGSYARALILQGRFLLAEGRLDEAVARVGEAISHEPQSTQGHYLLGVLHALRNDQERAAQSFNRVLDLNPRAVAAQIALADLELVRGAADASLNHANAAVRLDPRNTLARLAFVRGLIAKGDVRGAEAELKALATAFPRSAAVHEQWGALSLLKRDREGARRALDRALELDSTHTPAFNARVTMDLEDRKVEEARRRIAARLATAPDDPEALLLAGRAYAIAGDAAGAEETLRKVMTIAPNDLRAYALLGHVHLARGQLNVAKAAYEQMIQQHPTLVAPYTMMGMIFEAQANLTDARTWYQRALDIDGRAPVAANNLAWLETETGGNLDRALQLAQVAKAQLPTSPEVDDTLGWVLYKKGLDTLAIGAFQEAVRNAKGNPVYHYHLGLAYAKTGDRDRARRALEAALGLSVNFEGAAEARAQLVRLAAAN